MIPFYSNTISDDLFGRRIDQFFCHVKTWSRIVGMLKAFYLGGKCCPFLTEPLAKIKQTFVMFRWTTNGKFEQVFLEFGLRLTRFSSEIPEKLDRLEM